MDNNPPSTNDQNNTDTFNNDLCTKKTKNDVESKKEIDEDTEIKNVLSITFIHAEINMEKELIKYNKKTAKNRSIR